MLASQRHLFEIPADISFLNCAYLGPLARSVRTAGEAGIAEKCQPWTMGSSCFFRGAETLRAAYGRLLHTAPDNIALTPSASYGLAVAAKNLPATAGQRIVLLRDQFPSNVYVWQQLAKDKGLSVTFVARSPAQSWTDALLNAIDDSVAIAALPHCHWVDGGIVDLRRVRDALRSVGAAMALDVTQSLGVLDLDVDALAPDFVVASAYKWLLGPYRQAVLYVHPAHHAGEPLEHNWTARKGSEDFSRLVDYQNAFQPAARRFDAGARSDFITVPMMVAALALIEQWTVPAIEARIAHLNGLIASAAEAAGYTPTPSALRAPHYLTLEIPGQDAQALADALAAAQVHVSVRGSRLRISPHVYNTEDDVDRLVTVLARNRR